MKAAILTELNAPLTIAEVECGPLAYGQVRVRVLAAGICGAQLQEIRGEKGGPLPHLMGHEGCGIVEETGPGVKRVKAGDKVVMHWRKAEGIESDFPVYKLCTDSLKGGGSAGPQPSVGEHRVSPGDAGSSPARCTTFTSGLVTTWAEETICSENRLTPVPEMTPVELCVMLGCSLSTALATLETETKGFGESILIIGAGGLGMALLGVTDLVAPSHVCICDVHESKRRHAEIHADAFVNLARDKLSRKYDLVLDTAGAPAAMEQALEHLAPSGRYVMIGQPAPGKPVCMKAARHMFDGEGKMVRATQGGGFRPHLDIPRYLQIAERLLVHNLITHRVKLDEINIALDLVRAGEAGRVLVQIAKE